MGKLSLTSADRDDALWVDRVVGRLPEVAVPADLEARVLASFDAVTERRARGNLLDRFARGLRDAVWPGAPVWQPAAVLALSLAAGLAIGAVIPLEGLSADAGEQAAVAAFDSPPSLDLEETS